MLIECCKTFLKSTFPFSQLKSEIIRKGLSTSTSAMDIVCCVDSEMTIIDSMQRDIEKTETADRSVRRY